MEKMERNMKFMKAVVLLSLLSISAPTVAHIFSFSNHTNYPLRLKLKLDIDPIWHEREVAPRTKISYDWTALGHPTPSLNIWNAGLCLHEIRVETPWLVKTTTIDDDGNEISSYEQEYERDSSGKPILKDGKKVVKWNPERSVVITWVKDQAFDAVLNAGKMFADGLADAAAKAAGIALGGVPMPEFKLSPFADLIGTALKYSLCIDRHIDIVEDAEFSTPSDRAFKFLIPGRI